MKHQTGVSTLALLAGLSLLCSSLSLRAQDSEDDLFSYAAGGEVEEVQRLLDKGLSPNAADEDGETALMFAVGSAVPEVVRVLLEAGADPNAKNSDGLTALMAAAIGDGEMDDEDMRPDYLEMATLIIEAGAEVDARDSAGKSALDHAKWYRLVEMAELLEEAAD